MGVLCLENKLEMRFAVVKEASPRNSRTVESMMTLADVRELGRGFGAIFTFMR